MGYQHQTRPKTPLIRDPADWAREQGWVSRLRAERAAKRLDHIAQVISDTLGDEDDLGEIWADSLIEVANYLAPKRAGAKREP